MSSILAYEFSAQRVHLPAPVAGMLLSAILSDTLNLRSPTTTEWDRRVVSMLVQYCKVEDSNLLCTRQFKAKSMGISLMSAYTLVQGDLKQFKFCADSGEITECSLNVHLMFTEEHLHTRAKRPRAVQVLRRQW
jgi:inorganic pyrophosphatase/exopolyphosphatase